MLRVNCYTLRVNCRTLRVNCRDQGYPIRFPGAAYDHTPAPGELLLFPPWQKHEVLPLNCSEKGLRLSLVHPLFHTKID